MKDEQEIKSVALCSASGKSKSAATMRDDDRWSRRSG
jgi:hypothetical protein